MKKFFSVGSFALIATLMAGCGGSGSSSITRRDPAIQFFNLAPTVALDMLVDDTATFSNIASGAASSGFSSVESRIFDYSIRENGSTVELDNQANTLGYDTDFVAIAYGKKDFGTENAKRIQLSLNVINRTIPNGNKSRVYALNTMIRAAGEDAYAVVFKNPGTNPTVSFDAVNYGGITSKEIDSGSVTLTAQRQSTETEVVTVTKDFEPGKIYLMVFGGEEPTPTITFFEIQPR